MHELSSSLKILLIADKQTNTQVSQQLSSCDGIYQIIVAQDYRHGLAILSCEPAQVILLDVSLADSEAKTSLHALLTEHPSIPVVVLANEVNENDLSKFVYMGAQDFLIKGVDSNRQVCRAIHNAVGRKLESSHLEDLSKNDVLTGLPNREYLRTYLARSMAQAARKSSELALLFIGIDYFKTINDSLGHKDGDELLKMVAERLNSNLKGCDFVARLGSDEFALLLEDVIGERQVRMMADEIMQILREPFQLKRCELHITVSIGITLYPVDGKDITELLKSADMALNKAKDSGRNNFKFFKPSMHIANFDMIMLGNDLYHAVEKQQLQLFYQPKISMSSGEIIGLEALVRWFHPERGIISPLQFISMAERSGLIDEIGMYIIYQACQDVANWQQQGFSNIKVAVNISAKQFQNEKLTQNILNALKLYQLETDVLEVEITESLLMKDTDVSSHALRLLKDAGITIAVDDFGTGYSSLAYLKRFPIDTLKIDRSFVNELPGDNDSVAIAKAIIALGHSLDLLVIAEGIENEDQLSLLEDMGCDQAQGFYFSKPMPTCDVETYLNLGKPRESQVGKLE